ncbi:hypothetical protein [Aquimarina sediminis]|uniref:hypothetical protein n=1 Tax=Aquimarina sediminis TaxID=2070536 RepID=UPI000CA070D5|nr:hypothetical protein [Aquimarina sediminis]
MITIAILYFSLDEKLPNGKTGTEADRFALKIQETVKHHNYLNTDYLQWTFRNKNHYIWNKKSNTVTVKTNNDSVLLYLDDPKKSKILGTSQLDSKQKGKILKAALASFNNDSFWIVAPHKLFDKGTTRKLVRLQDGTNRLLVTYASGGTTPGDSYLWKVDKNYLPISYKMWVSIIPIGGIEVTWENWVKTSNGSYFAKDHTLLGFDIPISNLKAWNE